jgi:hypothetical protein
MAGLDDAWWRNGIGMEPKANNGRSALWSGASRPSTSRSIFSEEVYHTAILKVVNDEDILVYDEDDESLMDMEEVPLSVRRRNSARKRVYAPGTTDEQSTGKSRDPLF